MRAFDAETLATSASVPQFKPLKVLEENKPNARQHALEELLGELNESYDKNQPAQPRQTNTNSLRTTMVKENSISAGIGNGASTSKINSQATYGSTVNYRASQNSNRVEPAPLNKIPDENSLDELSFMRDILGKDNDVRTQKASGGINHYEGMDQSEPSFL